MSINPLSFERDWTNPEDFIIDYLEYEKVWTDSVDFPRYEPSEEQVRKDMQYHPDAIKDYINKVLIPAVSETYGEASVRAEQEQARQEAEAERQAAEAARQEAEAQREAAETGYVAQAQTAAAEARDSATAAAESLRAAEQAVTVSAQNAETATKQAEASAQSAAESLAHAQTAEASAKAAAESESTAAEHAKAAALSEDNARASEVAAAKSASAAAEDALAALEHASAAMEHRNEAYLSEVSAQNYATLSRSWAEGGTGIREGEDENNAKYWCSRAKRIVDPEGLVDLSIEEHNADRAAHGGLKPDLYLTETEPTANGLWIWLQPINGVIPDIPDTPDTTDTLQPLLLSDEEAQDGDILANIDGKSYVVENAATDPTKVQEGEYLFTIN